MNEEIKRLLVIFKDDDRAILELEKYDILTIAEIALKEGLIDEYVKLFSPIEIDGVTKIYFDYFGIGRYDLGDIYEKVGIDEQKQEQIISRIYDIDLEKIKKIKIKDSHAREISVWGQAISGRNDVLTFAEPACIEAMLDLYEKNIPTTMNDTNGVIEDKDNCEEICKIWINYEKLDEENKKVVEELLKEGVAHYVKGEPCTTIGITVPCRRDDTVGEVSSRLMAVTNRFKIQDVLYTEATEEVIKTYYTDIKKYLIESGIETIPYEEMQRLLINHVNNIHSKTYESRAEIIRKIMDHLYEESDMREFVMVDKMFSIYIERQMKRMKEEDIFDFIETYTGCYIDSKNKLIFSSEDDYLKHQRYLDKIETENMLQEEYYEGENNVRKAV